MLVFLCLHPAKHNNTKTQCESLKSQVKEISVVRSKIGSLEQEKNALQVEHSTLRTQCQALQSQVEEIPGLRSQVKALGEVGTALRGEKAGLEAELKPARSELEKCQIEVKSLRKRIQRRLLGLARGSIIKLLLLVISSSRSSGL